MLLQIEFDPRDLVHQKDGRIVVEVDEANEHAVTLTTIDQQPEQFDSSKPRYANASSIREVFVGQRGALRIGYEQRVRRSRR